VLQDDLLMGKSSLPQAEVSDYNKIVGMLHEEAFKDAQTSKKAKLQKMVKRQERR